jgi:predicted membrane protein (TIGR00267 family)
VIIKAWNINYAAMLKLSTFRRYIKVTGISEIARRYFVMNGFDGALTMLGILIGAYLSGNPQVTVIINAGLGASIAMGVSGISGAYMTEKAERLKKLKDLEDTMLVELDNTLHGRASHFASIYTAVVDGISPALAAMVILSPFMVVNYFGATLTQAIQASLIITSIILFLLGAYLAKISDEKMLKYGFQMLLVGVVTGVIIMITTTLTGGH